MASCGCCDHARAFFMRGLDESAQPIFGAVTFSGASKAAFSLGEIADKVAELAESKLGGSRHAPPGMIEHVQRAVDDYVAGLGEVEGDAATVVELVQRGDSWHVSIRSGAMHYENAEPSLPAALEAVGRVLGQSVGSCAEVPTDCGALGPWHGGRCHLEIGHVDHHRARYDDGSVEGWGNEDGEVVSFVSPDNVRAELLASLPPCQITDPEALAKLTPARVRAYLKGKGWNWRDNTAPTHLMNGPYLVDYEDPSDALRGATFVEGRSAAAVYLDILQAEPEA